ncbi:DUF3662 and FHA domain-containing protein [Williamsia maris]|uniref:FOG: FHA domain n=1 Tax=Williamsia maris TaxID=72806 RepID=A0ABT1HD06_9NOCA|nr:DUF3662 and FHA domain-containing protein [Williamsia maris]MCP2176140.1 FOG: FHA domain [Williamsia maris]
MGILQRIERKLEGAVDDGFARVFGGKVAPQEVEGALQREAEDSIEDLGDGGKLVPNSYTVVVSSTDHEQMAAEYELNRKTFSKHLEHFIRDNGWQTYGDVIVEFEHSPTLHTGQFRARGAVDPDVRPQPVGSRVSAPPPAAARPRPHPTAHGSHPNSEAGALPMTQNSGPDQRRGYEPAGGYDQGERGYDQGDRGYGQGAYPPESDRGYGAPAEGGYVNGAGYEQGGYEQGGYRGGADAGGYAAPDADPNYADRGYRDAGYQQGGGYDRNAGYEQQPGYDQGAYRTGGGYQQGGYGQAGGYDQGGYDQNYDRGYQQGDAAPNYADPGYRDEAYREGGYDQGGYAPRGGYQQGYADPQHDQAGYAGGGYDQGGYQGGGYDQGYGAATAAPAYAPTAITLVLEDGSNRTFALRDGSNVIGRGQDAQFRLPDTGVSRRHVEIRWDGHVALLHDLNSTNGTTVNDVAVSSWELADGDRIRVGHSDITVRFG